MEANRKRRGFIKGKLMPFYRAANKSSSTVQYSSQFKPSQSSLSPASVGYVVHHHDYVIAQRKPNVSFFVPAPENNNNKGEKLSQLEKLYGVVSDENVDMKATIYISSVQERFKLERVNSERMKYQDSCTH